MTFFRKLVGGGKEKQRAEVNEAAGPNDYYCIVQVDLSNVEVSKDPRINKDPNVLAERVKERILHKDQLNDFITYFKDEKALKDLLTTLNKLPFNDPLRREFGGNRALVAYPCYVVKVSINPSYIQAAESQMANRDFAGGRIDTLKGKYDGKVFNLVMRPGLEPEKRAENIAVQDDASNPHQADAIKIKTISSIEGEGPYHCRPETIKLVANFSAQEPAVTPLIPPVAKVRR